MKGFKRRFDREPVTPRVLVIEKSDTYAAIFERSFAKVALHWQFHRVEDGATALQHIVRNGFPDLLVTCLETPRLNAPDVAEWVRGMKTARPLPIIIFDDVDDARFRSELQGLGVETWLDRQAPSEKFRNVMLRIVARVEQDMPAASAA